MGPQCVQKRAARRMLPSAAEADTGESRAGIHNDRGTACKLVRAVGVRGVSASKLMHYLIINSRFGSKLLAARLPRTPPA